MACYVVPALAAAVHYSAMRKTDSWKRGKEQKALSLLLMGGVIFGVVDHLWNGELFLIGPNIAKDIMLGFTITIITLAVWAVLMYLENSSQESLSTAKN